MLMTRFNITLFFTLFILAYLAKYFNTYFSLFLACLNHYLLLMVQRHYPVYFIAIRAKF